jgi:hypothetical protein
LILTSQTAFLCFFKVIKLALSSDE